MSAGYCPWESRDSAPSAVISEGRGDYDPNLQKRIVFKLLHVEREEGVILGDGD
jgi:hypothetical protein